MLGGVCVYEAQVEWFGREMDKLATPYDKNPEDVEFHASTIFSRREDPWKSLGVDEARGLLKSVLQIAAASYGTARLFACAIHKKSYPNADPVELAFEDLCQRFDYCPSLGGSKPSPFLGGHPKWPNEGQLKSGQ